MHYNLIITERADELLDERLDYLVNRLKNEQAAKHLLDGMDKLYDRFEDNPFQFADCRDSSMRSKGYKEAVVSDMDYIIIFRVEDDIVYVLGIFHQLENYKVKL
ncbi:type II toxin-antitoxin system RelE/ParE family toxin [Lachnospiraceae bacterium OttesenSCG-928-E19]|nr:type II toxin-antitoxin system RelE/ParE family toxin [Lachnospiraceae bacterium OttesenSCG-928-E19]